MPGDKKRNPIFGISVRRFIEGKYAAGFKGDNRGPSLSHKVGYRTSASLFFDLEAGKLFAPIVGFSTGTKYVGYGILDAISPDASAIAEVSTKGSTFIGSEKSVYGRIRTSACDPLVPLAPDLDTVLTFKAVITGDLLTISGHLQGDGFTGAEVIISYKDGRDFLLTHKSEGNLLSLGDKYLKELGIFTKKYIVDEEGFIVEELSPLDPRYKDLNNTLFGKGEKPTVDVFLPPVTQAEQLDKVTPILHYNDLLWKNNEPTTDEIDSDDDGDTDMSHPPADDEADDGVDSDENQQIADDEVDGDDDGPDSDEERDEGESEDQDTSEDEKDEEGEDPDEARYPAARDEADDGFDGDNNGSQSDDDAPSSGFKPDEDEEEEDQEEEYEEEEDEPPPTPPPPPPAL